MIRKTWLVALAGSILPAAVFGLCLVSLAPPAAAQSADELVQKYIAALGGRDKLKAVQSLRVTGTVTVGPMPWSFTSLKARPNKMRTDTVIDPATTMTQAFDGTNGWLTSPMARNGQPQTAPPELAKDMRDQAEFDPWPLDYQARGTRVESLGRDTVDGKPASKLRVTRGTGIVTTVWLDAATSLEIKSETTREVQGQAITAETLSSKYQTVEGLTLAMHVETRAKGQPGGQVVEISRVEVNPMIDPATFTMPAR